MRRKRPHPLAHRRPLPPARPAGLTLIELMTTVAVLVICLSLAVPAYQRFLERNRADTATYLLTSLFASARATAITYRRVTSVCPTDGTSPWCIADGDWSHGWLMFTDPDGDRQPDSPDEVLRHERFPAHPSLRIRSSTGRPQLRYLPDGRSAGSNLTLRICGGSRMLAEVTVNNAGRPRVNRPRIGKSCAP
jgi:type IV fimbrial biogenesis protein FimT